MRMLAKTFQSIKIINMTRKSAFKFCSNCGRAYGRVKWTERWDSKVLTSEFSKVKKFVFQKRIVMIIHSKNVLKRKSDVCGKTFEETKSRWSGESSNHIGPPSQHQCHFQNPCRKCKFDHFTFYFEQFIQKKETIFNNHRN